MEKLNAVSTWLVDFLSSVENVLISGVAVLLVYFVLQVVLADLVLQVWRQNVVAAIERCLGNRTSRQSVSKLQQEIALLAQARLRDNELLERVIRERDIYQQRWLSAEARLREFSRIDPNRRRQQKSDFRTPRVVD